MIQKKDVGEEYRRPRTGRGRHAVRTRPFVALYASTHYAIGELQRMGPGFFPTVLAWILAGFEAVILLRALRSPGTEAEPAPALS